MALEIFRVRVAIRARRGGGGIVLGLGVKWVRVGTVKGEEVGFLEGAVLGGGVGFGEVVTGEHPVGSKADSSVEDLGRGRGGSVEEGRGEARERVRGGILVQAKEGGDIRGRTEGPASNGIDIGGEGGARGRVGGGGREDTGFVAVEAEHNGH